MSRFKWDSFGVVYSYARFAPQTSQSHFKRDPASIVGGASTYSDKNPAANSWFSTKGQQNRSKLKSSWLFRIGPMQIVQLLLIFTLFLGIINCNIDPDAALLQAAEHGNVEGIKEALNRGAHMGSKNNFATSPLIFAANNGHLDAVRYLLDINANIEDVSNNGRSPLMWACYWGHAEVVKYLVSRGANIDATDYGE